METRGGAQPGGEVTGTRRRRRRCSLRTLLYVTLITNLLTNSLLLGAVAIFVVIPWIQEAMSTRAFADAGAPSGQGPGGLAQEGAPLPRPAPGAPAAVGSATPAPPPPVHERLGIPEAEWLRLRAGEVISERVQQTERTAVQARFVVQGGPQELFDLLTDYPRLPLVYADLESASVLERKPDAALIYYTAKYGFFSMDYYIWEHFAPDRTEIRWELERETRLSHCEGFWRFRVVEGTPYTLVAYQNDLTIRGAPEFLMKRFMLQNTTAIAESLRQHLVLRRRDAGRR